MVRRTENGKTVTIVYDGDGNRAKKIVTTSTNTVTTWFLVDTVNLTGYAQVLEKITTDTSNPQLATPQVTRTYSYGHDLISQQQFTGSGWELSFFGYDGHGNTRFLTDANGFVTDTYDYDAFGNLIARTGSTANNYLFTGEQYDADLGLYFLRARYQNTQTGRFWTMDGFEGVFADPTSLHKYTYCAGNPVNRLDPTGHFTLTEKQITTITVGTLAGMVIGGVNKFLHAYQEGKRGWELAKETSYGVLVGGIAGAGAAGVFAITPAWLLAHGYTQAALTGLSLGTGLTESMFAWIEYSYGNYYSGSAHALNAGLSFVSLGMWRILAPRFDASRIALSEGDAMLAIVTPDGKVIPTPNLLLSHQKFAEQALGISGNQLPPGYWIGTVGKIGDKIVPLNSQAFYGNQGVAPQNVQQAVQSAFQ